jgi:hypothetical protein
LGHFIVSLYVSRLTFSSESEAAPELSVGAAHECVDAGALVGKGRREPPSLLAASAAG